MNKKSVEIEEPFNPESWRHIHPALRPENHIFRTGIIDIPSFSANEHGSQTLPARSQDQVRESQSPPAHSVGETTIFNSQILEDIFADPFSSSPSLSSPASSPLHTNPSSAFEKAGETEFKLYQENLKKKKRNAGVWTDWDDWEDISGSDEEWEEEWEDEDVSDEGESKAAEEEREDDEHEGEIL